MVSDRIYGLCTVFFAEGKGKMQVAKVQVGILRAKHASTWDLGKV